MASLCSSKRGSLTLEAAYALPLLLFAATALLSLFSFSARQAAQCRKLTERAQLLAVTVGQSAASDPYIRLYDYERAALPVSDLFPGGRSVARKASVRVWIGYTGETFTGGEAGVLVYRTPEGEVYHRTPECTYLSLTVRALASPELEGERNLSGEKYHPCEYCVEGGRIPQLVYITDYGTSFHRTQGCQGIKRTVMAVPLSETGGMRCCSKCKAL